jgi:hypothetical protein
MAVPNRLVMLVNDLPAWLAQRAAIKAVTIARSLAPKLTGMSSNNFLPIYGLGYFGIGWAEDYVWYQAMGIRAFTMYNVAGKTIPMWIDDPTGKIQRDNPKAEIRTTASGRHQVLIFRRAAKLGQRKTITRNGRRVSVPMSYPGAPGRITLREAPSPDTRSGALGGQIAPGNVGVRWRHPGLSESSFAHRGWGASFLHQGIERAAVALDIPSGSMQTYTQEG